MANSVSIIINDDAAGAGAGTKCGDCEARNPTPSKPKSCKGSLYYSAVRNSKSKGPTCVGISGTYDKSLFSLFMQHFFFPFLSKY